jgi:tetrathionate reductase subunit C
MHSLIADITLNGSSLENIYWGILIVAYPFVSGLVAGSFVVASLSHVFRQHKLDKLAPLALILSFALLLGAPLTVLADARQPVNAFELFTRAHIPYSPLGDFTMIWLAYVVLMFVECYFAFRAGNVRRSQGTGWQAKVARIMALRSTDLSERAGRRDARMLMILSAIGIGLAFLFHGYIGFVFGGIKARAVWSTPLMPIMFIVSAMVSGVAFVYLVYVLVCRYYHEPVDRSVTHTLLKYLLAFILLDAYLDGVDIVTSGVSAYTQGPVSSAFARIFLTGPHAFSYLGLQLTLGLLVPLLLWVIPRVRRSVLGGGVISGCVLIGVFAMRYNVVIGGQMESKISHGLVKMSIPLTGFDSIQTVIGVFGAIFLLFLLLAWLLPWREPSAEEQPADEVAPGRPRFDVKSAESAG